MSKSVFHSLVIFIFGGLLLASAQASASLRIPTAMTASDRNRALDVLGYGSATKILGDPYPLGGYDGLEVGIATEIMQTDQISALGNKATLQGQTTYNTITIGKGIYGNIDTFVTFSLMGQNENVSDVGGQLRWGFYQASYLPIYLTAIFHGNFFNCENLVVTNSFGMDIIAGFKEGDVTLYFGGGPIQASGNFSGGSGGVTNTGQNSGNSISGSRFLGGLNIKVGRYFIVGEIDNYDQPAYAGKLGYRF